jgi:polygalacturonase
MSVRTGLRAWLVLALVPAPAAAADPPAVNVRDHGAAGDGKAKDHPAIQKAVDACAARGGGTVLVPAGTYLCGTVELKSRVRLFLDAGAVIAGSPDAQDYRKLLDGDFFNVGNPRQPHNRDQALIVARKAKDVGIAGPGTIDARGHHFYDQTAKLDARGRFTVKPWRPGPTVTFFDCDGVRLADFSVKDAPFFALNLVGCTAVRVTDLRVASDFRFVNSDGLHFCCCRGVTISGCQVETEDDALCFYTHKEGLTDAPAECSGVAVTNCVLASGCSGLRIGYSGDGHIKDMAFSNLVIPKAFNGIDFICTAKNTYRGEVTAAGPAVHDLTFSNVVIGDAEFGVTANVAADARKPGGVRDLLFAGLKVRSRRGNYLAGSKDVPVTGVTFRDADFVVTGKLEKPPEKIPDPLPIFGSRTVLPHAFLIRHAEDVAFRDCRIRWDGAAGDWGSALHVVDGREVDGRTLRAVPFRKGGAAVTSEGSEVRLPDPGK